MPYKHKGFLFGIGVVIIERGLDVMNITTPYWLGPSLLIIGGGIILWSMYVAIKEWQTNKNTVRAPVITEHPQGIRNILSIERQEPRNLPPLWITLIGTIVSLLLLVVAGLQTSLLISGTVDAEFSWELVVFYMLFAVLPLWLLLEPITDRQFYKSGKSSTAVEVIFVVEGDIKNIFDNCLNILEKMRMRVSKASAPNLIKAHTSKVRISVDLQSHNSNVEIQVICDAIWVTVKIGKGRNQRTADEFQKLFMNEFRASTQPMEEQKILVTPITHKRQVEYEKTQHLMWAELQITNSSSNELKDVQVNITSCFTLQEKQDSENRNDYVMWNQLNLLPFCIYWSERQVQPNQMSINIPGRATRSALVAFQNNSNGGQFNFNSPNKEWVVGGVKIDLEISNDAIVLWRGSFYIECRPNYAGRTIAEYDPARFEFLEWDIWANNRNIIPLEIGK